MPEIIFTPEVNKIRQIVMALTREPTTAPSPVSAMREITGNRTALVTLVEQMLFFATEIRKDSITGSGLPYGGAIGREIEARVLSSLQSSREHGDILRARGRGFTDELRESDPEEMYRTIPVRWHWGQAEPSIGPQEKINTNGEDSGN